MATNQTSVELLIRARDETKAALRSVQSGFDRFAAAQARSNARRDFLARQKQEIADLVPAYQAAAAKTAELGRQMSAAARPSKALAASFAEARAEAHRLKQEILSKGVAYLQTTRNARGSYAAIDALATGMRAEKAATDAATAALNANTAAAGRNAQAARRHFQEGGLAARVEGAYTSRKGRGPLGLRPYEVQNLGYQVNDLVTQISSGTPAMQAFAQQAGQIAQIFPGMISGVVRLAPAISVATAALSPFVSELQRANAEAATLREFDRLLTRSGKSSEYTATQLATLATILDRYSGSLSDARSALTEFVGDQVEPAYLERFGKSALDLAKVMDMDVSDAAKKVSDAFTGNADAVLALDDELNFLSVTERKHIEQLKEAKREADARTQAFAIFERRYGETAAKMRGPWSQILNDFAAAWRSFAEWVNFIDFGKARRQIDDLIARVQRLTRMLPGANTANAANTRATYFRNSEAIERLEDEARSGRAGNRAGRLLERAQELRRENRRLSILLQTQMATEAGGLLGTPDQPGDTTFNPPDPPKDRAGRSGKSDAERLAERRAEFLRSLQEESVARQFQLRMMDETEREARILTEIEQARVRAAEVGLELTADQIALIRQEEGALYDAELRQKALQLIEQSRLELAEARGEIESQEDFIVRKLRDAGLYTSELDAATGDVVATLGAEAREYANILRQIYQINDATRQRVAAEKQVSDLVSLRSQLQARVEFLRDTGQDFAADTLIAQMDEIDRQIVIAADHAISMWRAIGGPEAERAIFALQTTREEALGVAAGLVVSSRRIRDLLVGGAVSSFDRLVESLSEGERLIHSLRDAFLQFAADFLRQIARMIFQQMVFNALGGGGPDGKARGPHTVIAGLVNAIFRHGGGLANNAGARPVPAHYFNNALRYHGGGIAGLRPNEVPAILERNEEVLTESDPRHRNNLGRGGGGQSVKVVNVLDPVDLLDKALGADDGGRVLLNFVRRNPEAFKAVLG